MYDLQFWHVRRIIRGYRKRDTLKHQLLAEVVYASIHVMRDAKGKTVQDMFPMLFNDEDDDEDEDECESIIDDKEVERLRQLMREENARNNKSSKA